jgi:hypothetical protein
MEGFPDEVTLCALDWPATCRGPRPGNLDDFIPQGFGLGTPAIITPYGGQPSSDYYEFQPHQAHPFHDAPLTESAGGTLYFDESTPVEMLTAVLQTMAVYQTTDYVAFGKIGNDSQTERYLDQMRIVSHLALASVFGTTAGEPTPKQSLNIVDAAVAFVADQKAKWNDGSTFTSKLSGKAGGDGDFAKESLAFGFHVENTYWGVYRIWSRAWLVTK